MLSTQSYQLLLIEPRRPGIQPLSNVVRDTIERRLRDLGLPPETMRILDGANGTPDIDWQLPVAAIYFGGPGRPDEGRGVIDELRSSGLFILPVVPTLTDYRGQVPARLHAVNGMQLDISSDPHLEHVVARIMDEFRLLRSRRRVFISYKRSESRAVALQLYHSLDERSFEVFLDTHSIERGAEFQPMLWDQMADADILILLDTPNALTSAWVEQEVARAHNLGLGVVQVIWPEPHKRTSGTELCTPVVLGATDFTRHPYMPDGTADADAELTHRKLGEIAATTEATRAASLASRRQRVVTDFCRQALEHGLEVVAQPTGPLSLRHPTGDYVRVYPLVGPPDATLVHEICLECHADSSPSVEACLVYDPLGVWKRRVEHIRWLNDHLPARSLSVTEVEEWLTQVRTR